MRLLRDNSLTIVLVVLTLVTVVGMLLTGWSVNNGELVEHGGSALTLTRYAVSGHFLSAIFENWESEFLQISAYVMLTAILFQRGSAESKDPDETSSQDEDPTTQMGRSDAPLPVRKGSVLRSLYSYSLGIALAVLLLLSSFSISATAPSTPMPRPSSTVSPFSRSSITSPARNSGSSRSRTGSRSSSRQPSSSYCRYSSALVVHRNRSRSPLHIRRLDRDRSTNGREVVWVLVGARPWL